MLIFSCLKIVTLPFRDYCASVGFWVPRSSDARSLFGETRPRTWLQPLFPRSAPREHQQSAHKIAVTNVMIHIDKLTRCRELAWGGRGRPTSGVVLPNTRRRLSG